MPHLPGLVTFTFSECAWQLMLEFILIAVNAYKPLHSTYTVIGLCYRIISFIEQDEYFDSRNDVPFAFILPVGYLSPDAYVP